MTARRVLVVLLAIGMAVLSFDALRAYALTGHPLTDGVIPAQTIFERSWLAALWAIVVDLSVLAGIWAIKDDRRDWRAWLVLLSALSWTLGFQVFQLDPVMARAVPPVGLALAILVLDLGPQRERPMSQKKAPAPARLRAWVESGMSQPPAQPRPRNVPADVPADVPAAVPAMSQVSSLPASQVRKVQAWAAEGQSAAWITQRLNLSDRARKEVIGPLVRAAKEVKVSQNGDRP